ncbi:MAG: Zn-ribbon domain-containing OB-fold protein [Pseudomonadota bacterium]
MTTDGSVSRVDLIENLIDPKLRPLIQLPESPSGKPHLIGSKCNSCGEYFFPKRVICPNCLKDENPDDVLLGNRGKLYSYCIVKAAPLGFEAPYAIGYVDLPEGLRIFSPLAEHDKEGFKVGMDLELVVDKIREDETGQAVYGYKFRPVSL